ncbi:MAG: type II secretion system protein GspN [Deltaproteobacteria bacterium]|nr:type II secretion system protein GspN [Deltaproteobacteria bacterium]MCK5708982.1 type II secretion system protein GspN [Deltaproteobacteria bacterium]
MKDKIRNYKYFVPLSYITFFVVAFFVFLIMTFPGDIVKQRIVSEIQNSTPYKVDIQSADVSALLNVNLKGVKIYKSQNQFLELDSLTIKPSLFSVFSDSPKVPFNAKLQGGEIEGTVRLSKQNNGIQEIQATIKQVKVDSIPALISQDGEGGILINGVMDGELYVQFDPMPKGEFSFEVEELNIDNLKVKGMKLPSLSNLKSRFNGNIEDNLTNIKELSMKGNGIDIQITGTAPILWEISKGGILDLGYRIEITNNDLAKYKTFLSPYLAKHRDGSLGGKILGTIKNPRFEKDSVKRF